MQGGAVARWSWRMRMEPRSDACRSMLADRLLLACCGCIASGALEISFSNLVRPLASYGRSIDQARSCRDAKRPIRSPRCWSTRGSFFGMRVPFGLAHVTGGLDVEIGYKCRQC